jgi:uncharacterized membrane protein YphA (DoxX/SURF4 family)
MLSIRMSDAHVIWIEHGISILRVIGYYRKIVSLTIVLWMISSQKKVHWIFHAGLCFFPTRMFQI